MARDLYFYHHRVRLTVIHKGNSLVWSLNAIDSHARLAALDADL
jgi:hypothetical protein